jgi:hypothetical protein
MPDNPDADRARRVGLNEAVFREVNERVEAIAHTLSRPPQSLLLVCECGRIDCTERFEMSTTDYEALRSDPTLFAVAPGHGTPEVETVIAADGPFEVVRKVAGQATEIAVETDPRAR